MNAPVDAVSRLVLLILACRVNIALTSPATYNQQQTGDLNVQVHVKDVNVLALLENVSFDDYTDYDYVYDYGDLTVKPSTSTTPKPSTIAEEMETKEMDELSLNSTLNANESTSPSSEKADVSKPESENEVTTSIMDVRLEDVESGTVKTRVNDKGKRVKDKENLTEKIGEGFSAGNAMNGSAKKRCRAGYSPDGNGRCRRATQRRLSLLPFTMGLGSKLLRSLNVQYELGAGVN